MRTDEDKDRKLKAENENIRKREQEKYRVQAREIEEKARIDQVTIQEQQKQLQEHAKYVELQKTSSEERITAEERLIQLQQQYLSEHQLQQLKSTQVNLTTDSKEPQLNADNNHYLPPIPSFAMEQAFQNTISQPNYQQALNQYKSNKNTSQALPTAISQEPEWIQHDGDMTVEQHLAFFAQLELAKIQHISQQLGHQNSISKPTPAIAIA